MSVTSRDDLITEQERRAFLRRILYAVNATGYGDECRDDLRRRIAAATAPHHLESINEDAMNFVLSFDCDWPEQDHHGTDNYGVEPAE